MSMYDDHATPTDARNEEAVNALTGLHTASVDTLRGFEKMAEKAEPGFRPVVDGFCALHSRHVSQLDGMVRQMGGTADPDGSLMGSINRAVVSVRAVFDEIDADVMKNIRRGEETVLDAFDRAIATSLPQAHVETLTTMRAELSAMLNQQPHVG